ncbi:MAG: HAD-IIA family hydrolase [Haloarculaceae archaeon]
MVEGVVLDLDGTVYTSGTPIPGAVEAVERLRERGISVLFCSNNPTKTPAKYVDRLREMGIEADERDVLPASTVTRDYLREHHPADPTYLVGEPSLAEYLRGAGQELVDDPSAAAAFVVSWDRTFDYGTMQAALDGIDGETAFLGTDPDRVVPTDDGEMPGSGAVIGAVARTVGREPDRVLGKPAPEVATAALDRLGVDAADCLVVGDRMDTDLAMGRDHGMKTALVCTGVADRGDVPGSGVEPDYVLDSLADLPDRLADLPDRLD